MINQNVKNISIALLISAFVGMSAAAVPLSIAETAIYGGSNFTMAGGTPATVADLGGLDGDAGVAGILASGQVIWYSFEADGFTYLDITTNGSLFDTEIGLYDAAGNRIGNDDDDGIGLDSTLSFGLGSGLTLGDSFDLGGDGIADGEDGPLAAGQYYLAIGHFNTVFGDMDFNVTSAFGSGGDYVIDFYTDASTVTPMPEPSVLLLIGLGLVGIGFARRK